MVVIEEAQKVKAKLDAMAKKLNSTVEKGYKLAMESFTMEAKKKDLDEYYYCILNILVNLPFMPTPSQEGG